MGHDRRIAMKMRQFDRVERFGQCADLIDLHQNGVRRAFLKADRQTIRIGYEQIVAHQLNPVTD